VTIQKNSIPEDILPEIKLKLNRRVWHSDLIYGAVKQLPPVAENFIFGGDWNTSRLFDKVYGPRGNQEFFDRMEAAGLVETFRLFYTEEIQTWFKKSNSPYQLDHLFSDRTMSKTVRNCMVDSKPALEGLSDHAMLVVDFNPF